MRHRVRVVLGTALAAAALLAACGNDAEKLALDSARSTPVPPDAVAPVVTTATAVQGTGTRAAGTPRASAGAATQEQINCEPEITSYRYTGRLSVKALRPPVQPATPTPDEYVFTFDGAYVAPDRRSLKLDAEERGGGNERRTVESVRAGGRTYIRSGAEAWRGLAPTDDQRQVTGWDPRELCASLLRDLPGAFPEGRKERVNGVPALRVVFDRAAFTRFASVPVVSPGQPVPDELQVTLWLTEQERFPVKINVRGAERDGAQPFTVTYELEVKDLNASSIRIDAPRPDRQ